MPKVGGKKFPYTAKGKKEAEKYAKKTGKKMKKKIQEKNVNFACIEKKEEA